MWPILFILILTALILFSSFRITTYLVARGIRNSLGNKIDHAAGFLRWCQGDIRQFRKYKHNILGPEWIFPSELFDPSVSLPIQPRSWGAQKQTLESLLFGDLWEQADETKLEMMPYIQDVVHRHLKLAKAPLPSDLHETMTVHLRFSDCPFNRHETQLLYKHSWFAKAFDLARKQNPELKKILIVSCHAHQNSNSKRQAICKAWVDAYQAAFHKATSLPVTLTCNSVYDDFKLLYASPVLIASPSSFSHYAGICSTNNLFITSTTRLPTFKILTKLKPPGKLIALSPECLYQEDVPSYYDIDDVLGKLAA